MLEKGEEGGMSQPGFALLGWGRRTGQRSSLTVLTWVGLLIKRSGPGNCGGLGLGVGWYLGLFWFWLINNIRVRLVNSEQQGPIV